MSKLGLTDLERNYVSRMTAFRQSRSGRLGFYSAVMVPVIGFALYGWFRGDFVALGLAFTGLLIFVLWYIAGDIKHAPVFFSLFTKIEAFEREDGT